MPDIKSAHHIKQTTLADGTTIRINDHVYLAPEHLGEPYYIGRVMEFVTSHKRKGLLARIAWFNRPKDVINRKSADPCLLVATMHSDVNPVSSIRGKCTVTHKYYVPKDQMDSYRKEPDNFYYNQLYDRYIQRVYDVVPCETVQNVPTDTLEALKSRYQFIVVEQGKASELTTAKRMCCVCQEWCQSAVSVKCAGCQKSYHMSCLNPPLIRKPSKGFAWQCAFCTRQDLLNDKSNASSPNHGAAALVSLEKNLHRSKSSKSSSHIGSKRASPDTGHSDTEKEQEKSTKSRKTESKRQTRATRSQLAAQLAAQAAVSNKQSPTQQEQKGSASTTAPAASPAPQQQKLSETSIKLKINHIQSPKNQEMKMTHTWPFRYFGVNTEISDILDVDDRIYPRAKSRIGARYQATVAEWDMTTTNTTRSLSPSSDAHSPSANSKSAKSSSRKNDRKGKSSVHRSTSNNYLGKRSAEASPSAEPMEVTSDSNTAPAPALPAGESSSMIPIRGGNETVTCIYSPDKLPEEKIDEYMNQVKELENIPLDKHSADRIDRALLELEKNNYDTTKALQEMSKLTEKDFKHVVDWSQKEINAFEQSIREHGHDLNYVKMNVQTKSMADIVRFFYQWKKTDRYETVYSEWTKIYRPMKKFKKFPRDSARGLEEEDGENDQDVDSGEESDPTIVPKATYTKTYQCMNCFTEESKIWRRSPSDFDRKRKIFNKVLCNDCGIYWLKYAKTKPVSAERRSANSSSNTTPTMMTNALLNQNLNIKHELMKRKRSDDHGGMKSVAKRSKENNHRSTTPLKFTPSACKVCQQMEPAEQQLYTCYHCGMSVHNDCYGIEKQHEKEGWLCDPCSNKVQPIASYDYECVLCHKSAQETQQPLKRTAGYYWAHVQCAAFIPEIKFVQPTKLSPVEYIGCINQARKEANCSLCDDTRGACVACSECRKTVHVQCAIDHQYKLAFEIQPNTHNSNKSTKYPIVPAGLFGPSSPSGLMIPQVWCPQHNVSSRKLIDLSARTTDEAQESFLMTYVKKYKCIAKGTTPALRRLRAARQHQSNSESPKTHHRMPNPREAVLEALSMDEHPNIVAFKSPSSTPVITKLTLTTSASSSSSSKHTTKSSLSNSPSTSSSETRNSNSSSSMTATTNIVKRTCSTPGCLVRHTPIWWSTEDPDKKICQRCHQSQVISSTEDL